MGERWRLPDELGGEKVEILTFVSHLAVVRTVESNIELTIAFIRLVRIPLSLPWNFTDVDGERLTLTAGGVLIATRAGGEPVIVALSRDAAQQLAQAAATIAANYPDDEEDDE